jgi:hypothetical protein
LAYLREAKDDDGKSWPEWTGEKRADHHDNGAREKARRELERDIAIPGYSELVGATVGQRMSTAADTTMSHLSTFIFLSHARLKAKQCSVGGSSPPALIESANDYVRGVRDQIEVIQYIRGRIGEDRSTVLDMGRAPDYGTRFPAPSAGQKRAPDSPEYSPVTEDDEAAESARKRLKSSSTMADSQSLTPLTGSDQYSPVTEDEPDARVGERHVGVKNETQADDMDMAKIASRLTDRQGST